MPVLWVHHKKYRLDLKRWETKFEFCKLIFYRYDSIWRKPIVKLFTPLPKAEYFEFRELPKIRLTQEQFKNDYQSNKWLVPVNRELPCAE